MTTTYLLEELDEPTREYLLHVRDGEDKGTPGAYAPTSNSWPTLGCIFGPIIILGTLFFTLNSDTGIVFDDPTRVALLQTAGLLVGGWMFVAALRVWARKRSDKYAGHWVYADPLHLYEAKGEQVKVTPLEDLVGARATHNLNNDKYQNTALEIRFTKKRRVTVQMNHQGRADRLAQYLAYIGWCYGPDGGDRAKLPPAVLGALARYVAKNEEEPVKADGGLDLDLLNIASGEVPEDPQQDRRATPKIVAYLVMLPAVVICPFIMAQINIPFRDDAIFAAVTHAPVEPRFLRSYLVDPRNTAHREAVAAQLSGCYSPVIQHVRATARDEALKTGLVKVLESLRRAEQPIVSIRVRETKSPKGAEAGAADRAKQLEDGIATRTNDEFGKVSGPVQPTEPGVVFTEQPPPIGHQLIAFTTLPEGETTPHFDIEYAFEPDKDGKYRVTAQVTIRVAIKEAPVTTARLTLPKAYTPDQASAAVNDLKEQLIQDMVGAVVVAPPMPAVNIPGFQVPGFQVPGGPVPQFHPPGGKAGEF